jgi:hypothetical protein
MFKKFINALKEATVIPTFKKDARIVEAFVLDGIQYYQFDDIFGVPVERAFAAIDIYGEVQSKCTREYLLAHSAALKETLNSKRIDILKVGQLITQLDERLETIFDADLIYKLASVVYFDATENPYKYDYKHGIVKMQRFRKSDIEAFFLNSPIQEFLPFKNISKEDLSTYIQVGREITLQQLQAITAMLSNSESNPDLLKELEFRNITQSELNN